MYAHTAWGVDWMLLRGEGETCQTMYGLESDSDGFVGFFECSRPPKCGDRASFRGRCSLTARNMYFSAPRAVMLEDRLCCSSHETRRQNEARNMQTEVSFDQNYHISCSLLRLNLYTLPLKAASLAARQSGASLDSD